MQIIEYGIKNSENKPPIFLWETLTVGIFLRLFSARCCPDFILLLKALQLTYNLQ